MTKKALANEKEVFITEFKKRVKDQAKMLYRKLKRHGRRRRN